MRARSWRRTPCSTFGASRGRPTAPSGPGLLADVLVSIELGVEKRNLGGSITTITFGDVASTVYAVRWAEDGDNDVSTVLAIDFASGDTTELAVISYPRPAPPAADALADAESADDGGPVRLFWLENDMLRLWVIGAGQWDISPEDGTVTPLAAETAPPTLWAPDGEQRIAVTLDAGVSTLALLDENDEPIQSTTVDGSVSHLRWSPTVSASSSPSGTWLRTGASSRISSCGTSTRSRRCG